MKFPWMNRRQYDQLRAYNRLTVDRLACQIEGLKLELAAARCELAHARDCYAAMRELEQQERWRRLRAEGLVQFKDDRIRRVLGLPGFHQVDEPRVDDEGKKTA